MPTPIKVRITNTTKYPIATKVELLIPNESGDFQALDLTKEASIYWPIKFEVEGGGAFAILKFPLESVSINE